MMAHMINCVVCVSCCLVFVLGQPGGFGLSFNESSVQSYYFFSHDKETWTGALVTCQVLGGYLVEIDSEREYQYLRAASQRQEGISRWIALSDKREISVWEWSTSHTVYNRSVYDMWASGEPDQHLGQKDESCVLLDKFSGDGKVHDFQLADVMCDRREKYICEYNPPQIPILAVGK